MILRYSMLQHKPSIFKAMTGLSVALFDELVWNLEPGYAQATVARREQPGRTRAVGAGHPCCLTARDEFLLTVIWLRHYVTQEALGYFFGVSDTTALRAIGRVLPVLEAAGRDTMRQPPPSRRQRYGVAEALRAFPELADLDDEARVVDSFEQRVQRPTDQKDADRHYSGKKKAHTLKVQVVVELGSGSIREIAPSVPGPCADPTLLRDSGALDRLPPGTRMLGDKAYRWKKKAEIDAPLPPPVAIPRRKPRGKPLPPTMACSTGPSPVCASRSSTRSVTCASIRRSATWTATAGGSTPHGPVRWWNCAPGAAARAVVISAAWPNRGARGGGTSPLLLFRR